jgi:ribose transport system ATP-binding protein
MPSVSATAASKRSNVILELRAITKRFPGVVALRGVDFDLRRGEVHVVFGENGAGKSTLINIIAGTYPPDEGSIVYEGETVTLTPHGARALGINAVFQDFSLIPTLTVEQNLFLGRELGRAGFLDRRGMATAALKALETLHPTFSPKRRIDQLPRSAQQLVEIAKALMGNPRVLILDEPTTSLTEQEVALLFDLIATIKQAGTAVIYITHRMREIPVVGDRITVLRDGAYVATLGVTEAEDARLINLMTGRTLETLYPKARYEPGEERLRFDDVSADVLRNVSLNARSGEIVGVAGLIGSGKHEIGPLCFGLQRAKEGSIKLNGTSIRTANPKRSLAQGLIYHPADRRRDGLVLQRPVRENLVLAALDQPAFSESGFLRRRRERRAAREIITRLRIQPPNSERQAMFLSGGNQQKVVLGRALTRDVRIHVFDEPTAGVDVGSRVEVYQFMKELCENGSAVLLISSDLPEVVNLAHRVYVIHRGRVRAELEGDAINEAALLRNFFDTQSDPHDVELDKEEQRGDSD